MTIANLAKKFAITILLSTAISAAHAHEMTENRATLVLRDSTHVSMTLFIDYPEALHRALSPKQKFQEFVLTFSAMNPEVFSVAVGKAQALFQAQIQVLNAMGKPASGDQWRWPEPIRVQAMLREHAMQMLVAVGEHAHDAPLEIRAEFSLPKPDTSSGHSPSVRVTFPAAFRRVLVVSYRPNQVWVNATGAEGVSPEIKF